MSQNNIDLYYIPTDDDHMSEYIGDHFKCRSYMSGFTGSAGFLVVGHKEAGLWTDGRYFTQAEKQLKNSGIKLFKMGMAKVPTVFEYIVDKAVEYKLGARGLRAIVETIMMDVMFDLPSRKVDSFVVTLEYAKSQMEKANLSRLQMA